MSIATTNVNNLEEHKEQERQLKEKIDNVEHVDLSKIITIGGVISKQRKEALENVVVESDLKQQPKPFDPENESVCLRKDEPVYTSLQAALVELEQDIKKELSTIKATATRLKTHIDKELKKMKGEIKELKKKE